MTCLAILRKYEQMIGSEFKTLCMVFKSHLDNIVEYIFQILFL